MDFEPSAPIPQQPNQRSRIDELAQKKLSGSIRWLVNKELKKLPKLLAEAEDVISLGQGLYDGKNGLVVLTSRRVLFVEEGMFRSRLEDFPFDKISSVQTEKGFINGKLIIYASGNKAVYCS